MEASYYCMEARGESYYIQRVRSGDRESFTWLVDRYRDMVYTICLRMLGNDMDAAEAAQDAFVKSFRAMDSFQEKSKFSTWLYRITVNKCKDYIRRINVRKILYVTQFGYSDTKSHCAKKQQEPRPSWLKQIGPEVFVGRSNLLLYLLRLLQITSGKLGRR